MGQTDAGLTVPTAAQATQAIRDNFDAELLAIGLPADTDWSAQTYEGIDSASFGRVIGDVYDAIRAVKDQTMPSNATGLQLDNIAEIRGTQRNRATASTITIAVTGSPGTFIPAGSLASGQAFPDIEWALESDVTLGAGSTTVTFISTSLGPYAEPDAAPWTIVSPVPGWSTAISSTDSVPGKSRETDADLRIRSGRFVSSARSSAASAIAAQLQEIDDLESAQVIENDLSYSRFVEGKLLPANSINAIVWPNGLAQSVIDDVAKTVYRSTLGVQAFGTSVNTIVTASDGRAKSISFDYATSVNVDVSVTAITFRSGVSAISAKADIATDVDTYFASLAVGDDFLIGSVQSILFLNGGVSATITLNAGTTNIAITATEHATKGTVTVS